MIAQDAIGPPKENAPLCEKRRSEVRLTGKNLVSVQTKRKLLQLSLAQEIKQSVRLENEFERDGHSLITEGLRLKCLCPFHQERTPSCFIDPELGLFHCFGCGASGSVIDYYARKLGISVRDVIRQLARRTTLSQKPPRSVHPHPQAAAKSKPLKPIRCDGFELGTNDDLRKLAELRCLSIEGLRLAQADRVLWFATLHEVRAWIITDDTRATAQARRLDGEKWEHLQPPAKAWSMRGSCGSWPVGSINIRGLSVALTEGGPDMLTAYHFKWLEQKPDVTPVTVFGASNSIHASALSRFGQKRVRVFPHIGDAGANALQRWTHQLQRVGATVDWYDLAGLRHNDGRLVEDLNDFVLVDYDGWEQTRLEDVLP